MNKNTIIALIAFFAFALLLLAFVPPPSVRTGEPTAEGSLSRAYMGVTPCADCTGIYTRLTLTQDTPYSAEGTYELSLTYIDRAVEPYVETGRWTTERGTATEPDATVYALYQEGSNQAMRYRVVDEWTIRQLDGDGNEIDPSMPFDLIADMPNADGVIPGERTVAGVRFCLPHKDTTGPQTEECALGLKGEDGLNYALDLANVPLEQSSVLDAGRAEVTGTYIPIELLSSDHWMKYDVAGILSVDSIKAL